MLASYLIYFQAMHFFYGLGAFISPMIASPFLLNIDCTPFIDGVTEEPASELNVTISIEPQPDVVDRAMRLSHSKEAFFILGSIQVCYFSMSRVARKSFFGVSDQVRHKPVSTATENGLRLAFLDLGTIYVEKTKALFSCASVFAYAKSRLFS